MIGPDTRRDRRAAARAAGRAAALERRRDPRAWARSGAEKYPELEARLERLGSFVDDDRPAVAPAAPTAADRPLDLGGSSSSAPPPSNRTEKRAAGRVLSKHERKSWETDAARRRRAIERQRKYDEAHRAKMKERGRADDAIPPAFPIDLWISSDAAMHDTHGSHSRRSLDTLPPVWKAQIRRAALGENDAGECVRDYSTERARAIVAIGVAQARLSKPGKRKGRWTRLTRGITRGAWASLIQGPRARPVHPNTISGLHRVGALEPESSQLGYLQALEAAGFLYSQQMPASECEPWEVWSKVVIEDGVERTIEVTTNWYWLSNPNPFDGHLGDAARRMLIALAAVAESADRLKLRPRVRRRSEPPPEPSDPTPPDG